MEDDFEMKCLGELASLRKNATTDELISLQYSTFDDYVAWRKQYPDAAPWFFYFRYDAPDVHAIRKKLEAEAIEAMLRNKLNGK